VLSYAEDRSTPTGQLIYSRLTNGTWQIWKKNLASGERAQLTSSPGDKRYPAWAPDGRVTYCTSNQTCHIVREEQDAPLLTDLWPLRDVASSPDGKRFAFSKFRADLVDSANVWVTNSDGTGHLMLTHEPGIQYNPMWSPDGTQIAYIGGQGYGTYELYIINADGTERRRLTANGSHEFLPAWSPDGTQLAFASDASGDYEIWIVRADGSALKQLTQSPGLDTRPAWSPDGTQIAFVSNRTGVLEIWVINSDGADPRPLESGESGACDPAWRL
jgi:Tol biopolymer transport system component